MKTKLGVFFNPFLVTKDFLLKENKRVKQMEVDHVEILLDHYRLLDTSNKDVKLLKSSVSDWENIVHAPFIDISIVHPNEKIRLAGIEIYKSAIEVARFLDSKLITIHGGSYPFYIDGIKTIMDNFDSSVKNLIETAKFNGILISIENLPQLSKTKKNYPTILNEIKNVLSETPEIKFTLDIGHVVENKENIIDYIKQFDQKISNVHIHDSDGKKSHLSFGKGIIDIISVIKKLDKLGIYLTLEILNEEDTLKSFKYVKNILSNIC